MFAPGYKGTSFYVDEQSVADGNLITAGSTGALLWAKQIIEHLGVFQADKLESWYEYFSTGKPEHFFALMQTLPPQILRRNKQRKACFGSSRNRQQAQMQNANFLMQKTSEID